MAFDVGPDPPVIKSWAQNLEDAGLQAPEWICDERLAEGAEKVLLPVSDEMLEDAPQIQACIRKRAHLTLEDLGPMSEETKRWLAATLTSPAKGDSEKDVDRLKRYEQALEQIADGRPSYPVALRIAREARYPDRSF